MKIGFFLPNATFDLPGSPEVGGIETFAFTVGEALQEIGHEVVLFGGKPKMGRQHRSASFPLELFDYVETKSIPDLGTRFQRLIQRLHFGYVSRRAWIAHRFDVAILAKPFDWPVAYYWKKKQPQLKVIMGFHGTDFFPGDQWFFPRAVDVSFAVSAQVADLAYQEVGIQPAIIPNPVDFNFFKPAFSSAPKSEPFKLITTGRLVGWKGFHLLIEAIGSLYKEGVAIQCFIAGDGPERKSLEQLIESQNLTGKVVLCGLLSQSTLLEKLQTSNAYVAPSIGMEAFSIATLEAAAVGLPLLLSDQVGLSAFLSENDFISYPNRDVLSLKTGLKKLMERQSDIPWNDSQLRHERMKKLFAPTVVAQKIINLVSEI